MDFEGLCLENQFIGKRRAMSQVRYEFAAEHRAGGVNYLWRPLDPELVLRGRYPWRLLMRTQGGPQRCVEIFGRVN
jgi:hypothetical protein